MSDLELLAIVLMIVEIITTILVAYINAKK